jgi:hypothetical protein
MVRISANTPPDPQYEETVKAKDEMYWFLKQKGVENAGVGVGYNRTAKKWRLAIHLQTVPINPDPELNEVLQGHWKGNEVEVKHVGQIIPY